jgi:hypothetical protein
MELLLNIFVIVCLVLAVLCFVAFCAFFWLVYRKLSRETIPPEAPVHGGLGDTARPQGAPLVAPVLEAGAKVLKEAGVFAEKLSKASPPVVSLIASLIYLLLALGALTVLQGKEKDKKEKKDCCSQSDAAASRVVSTISSCVVSGFPDGEAGLPKDPSQEPSLCLERLFDAKDASSPALIFLVGHTDVRELHASVRRRFHDNPTLGYQRALAVQALISDMQAKEHADRSGAALLTSRVVLLDAGSGLIPDPPLHSGALAHDRSVEVLALHLTLEKMTRTP